jgi:hypothetical protein
VPLSDLPGYELLEELGHGGMGIVYKARQVSLGRLVAVKLMRDSERAPAGERARFKREAEAVARLQHPHVVQIFEVGEHQGTPYFVMEFCPNGSLESKLNGRPLPAREAAQLVEELALAVHAVHQAQVVHRDLKPANVLFDAADRPKVTDFGLAKKLDDTAQTQSGTVLGTPRYMAPEQAGGQIKQVGPAADVWALGVILYETLTGGTPFRGSDLLETLEQVRIREPLPPSRLAGGVPRDLDVVCLKCLEKEPDKRYASAAELADDLARFRAGEPVRARPGRWRGRLRRWSRHWREAALVLSVAALVLLAAQLPVFQPGADRPAPLREGTPVASGESKDRPEREPDLTITLPPSLGGRLGVRAAPALYDRYGAANTALALVLDCSGSMLARGKDKRTRFQRALRALRQGLEQLPAGVTVSLRAFSAEQFKDDPQQIRLIWPAHKWNPDALDRRMKQLSRLKPYYDTPLIRAIYQARNDFPKGFTGPRTIVALTDGGDSNFYDARKDPDADLKERIEAPDKTISTFLEQEFDRGIQVRVIGFEVLRAGFASPSEVKAYNELPRALKRIGGSYHDVADSARLAPMVRRALLPMFFWVDADEGESWWGAFLYELGARSLAALPASEHPPRPPDAVDVPQVGIISRSHTAENLRWTPLKPGHYVVEVPSLRSLRQSIHIRPGDGLLLELVQGKRGPAFRRSPYADLPSGFRKKAPLVSSWQLAVLQNQQRRGSELLQMLATLEKDEGPARSSAQPMRVIRPHWAWFEVPAPHGKGRPARLRVLALPGYPAPAWGLDLPSWPEGRPSALSAWWAEKELPVAGRFRLDQPNLGKVTIESVKLEKHRLEVRPGEFQDIDGCLVVRLRYPPGGEPFFVQLPGWDRGQEHRFFAEAGKYTGIFWPLTAEEADARRERTSQTLMPPLPPVLRALHLISVAELKKQALRGQKLELGTPDEKDRPRP